jgi:hypothetical protein
MKVIKFILISTLMFLAIPLATAQSNEVPSEVISALNAGDSGKLNNFLNANVELAIGNKNDIFSKPQASGIITDFFKTNKVNSFLVLHKGNKEAASFLIGTLKTSNANFRVYVYTRKSGSQTVIQRLRIEPSND